MTVTIQWFGHSAFVLQDNDKTILIDPFISGNPLSTTSADALSADIILLSHAHSDHVGDTDVVAGDTLSIAKRTGAVVVCNFEMGNWFAAKGIDNIAQGNPGGTFDAGFMKAKWTKAFHSSSFGDGSYGGQPNGYIITFGDLRLYFAGDTGLFGDMSLIGDEGIDVAFLPIGDLFTMGIDDSIKATKMLRTRYVVPMHYNTFPPIMQDVRSWAERINRETDSQPIVLDPGQSITLE